MSRLSMSSGSPKSLYDLHLERWGQGCDSDACELASKVCLGKGQLPCDVLFVGEAPGPSENVIGNVFVGPAGLLLDQIIRNAIGHLKKKNGSDVRKAFTNLVNCIPLDEDGSKFTEPPDEQIISCQPRLKEFVDMADPKLIICVGKLANDWLNTGYKHGLKLAKKVPMVQISHPARILRSNVADRGLMTQRCVIAIRNSVEEHVG